MEDNVLEIEEIKTPQDILTYMNENIEYGWMNINNSKHIKTMKEFRKIIKQLPNLNIGSCFILERLNYKLRTIYIILFSMTII